jgi:hypothetical protein
MKRGKKLRIGNNIKKLNVGFVELRNAEVKEVGEGIKNGKND